MPFVASPDEHSSIPTFSQAYAGPPRVPHDSIIEGDALTVLRELPDAVVDTCITSPPYWSLRDYGVDGQLGLEPTPEEYVQNLVLVFREVRRILKPGRTLWLVLGDTYFSGAGFCNSPGGRAGRHHLRGLPSNRRPHVPGLKQKDLVGIPWRVALALQADGWWLRNAIVWQKPNSMPLSIKDRLACTHETVFLLANAARYQFDLDAIREPYQPSTLRRMVFAKKVAPTTPTLQDRGRLGVRRPPPPSQRTRLHPLGKNPGDVWSIAHTSSRSGHHAVFPEDLARRAILAGSRKGDLILDPFCGTGTTLLVAKQLGRRHLGIELHPAFARLARRRLRDHHSAKVA